MDLSAATARPLNDSERDDSTHASKAVSNGLMPSDPSHDTSRTSTEENKFQGAISAWRGKPTSDRSLFPADCDSTDINLSKLVPELDTTASDIVTHQRDALVSRKDLAQKTKDFRKLDDAAKLAEFKGLLKCQSLCPSIRVQQLTVDQPIKHLLIFSPSMEKLLHLLSSRSIPPFPKLLIRILYSKPPSTRSLSQKILCPNSAPRMIICKRVLPT